MRLALTLFGGFEVRLDGSLITRFESDKVRALLAYMAIEADRPHRRETLAGLFWPERPEARARQSLSQALYNLRTILPLRPDWAPFEITSKEILLHSGENLYVDARQFVELVGACKKHIHSVPWACEACMRRLESAANLYRGELLAGFSLPDCEAFEAWLSELRAYLLKEVLQTLHWLEEGYEKVGKTDQALDLARQNRVIDPYDEAVLRRELRLLVKTGKGTEALGQYETSRRLMEAELGVQPDFETTALIEKIRSSPEAAYKHRPVPNNLPTPLHPLVGRQEELGALYWKLIDPTCRLMTILGMGGCGKTHLALEASRAMLPAFPDGVYWVELGPLQSQHTVLPMIAKTIGVSTGALGEVSGPEVGSKLQDDLYVFLRNRELLLVLDSAEGVQEGLGFLTRLLEEAPKLKVCVTSRTRLNLIQETIFPLKGMPYPEALDPDPLGCDSVLLLMSAIQRWHPHYKITPQNSLILAQICQAVQGIPLAILLAASWIGSLEADQLLEEITLSLGFLSAAFHDLPDRQRSLRATFEYSWGLLGGAQQTALKKLALFRQGFQAKRGLQIAGASRDTLRSLIDASLVQPAAEDRYQLHDQVRTFALEKLIEDPKECLESYRRFSIGYLEALANWDKRIRSAEQVAALDELDHEIENVRQAWDWRVQNGDLAGLEDALMGLCRYYQFRALYQDGRNACEFVLERIKQAGITKENLRLWARCVVWWDLFTCNLDREETTLEWTEAVCEQLQLPEWAVVDTRWEQAFAHQYLGNIRSRRYFRKKIDASSYLFHLMAASELFRQLEDAWQITYTLLLTANFYDDTNHPSELRRLAEEALEIQKMIGDPTLEAKMLDHLASSYLFEGKAEEGIGTMHQAVKSYQQTGLPAKAAEALMRYSVALAWGGLFKESLELSLQSFSLYKSLGKEMPEYGKMIICLLKMFLGHYDEQFRLVEEFDLPHLSRHYYLIFAGAAFLVIGEIDQAERLLEEAIGLHFKIGDYRLLTYFRALLSVTHYRGGDLPGAWNILQEAVRGWNEETNVLATCHLLLVSAFFLAELGELEKALEIYTAALQYRHMSNSVWAQDFAGKEITRRTSSLPAEVLAAAQARGERLNSKQAIEEGMEALREKPEWGEGLPRKGTRRHE